MNRKTLLTNVIVAATLSAAAAPTAAAEGDIAYIARITGSALVNKGGQYLDGTEGMALATGDRVMSLAESSAILQFSDGCRYTMKEDELVTIPSLSPCVLTKGPSDRLSVATLPPAPPAQVLAPIVPLAAAGAGYAWLPVAAAGLFAGGAILSAQSDDDDPRRPAISP